MRVISGSARGRHLKAVPGNGTRPTTDKVKEALFSIIGPFFEGGNVLDLFAGTGGLGIEALSRGMEHAIFIDLEPKSIATIHDNLKVTKLSDQAEVFKNDAKRALKLLSKREMKFELVFLDPPYRLKHGDELMEQMAELGLLTQDATIVLEHDAGYTYPEQIGGFQMWRKAEYGDAAISIYSYDLHQGQAETQEPQGGVSQDE
ncbi:Ribosomal RNA small subunit methyltransferase D [compost metagenome]